MPHYRIRLESQTDEQWRELTVAAVSEGAARQIAERSERDLVRWTLDPAGSADRYRVHDAAGNALVDLSRINAFKEYADRPPGDPPTSPEDAADEANDLLRALKEYHAIDATGKSRGPTALGRGHLHVHSQKVPYRIAAVDLVRPEVSALVAQMKAVYEQDADTWQDVIDRMRADGIPTGAVTASLFGLTAQGQIGGATAVVWATATHKVTLHTSAYTPDQDTHDFYNDVTNELSTGAGYTAGGQTLSTPSTGYDTATDQVRLDGVDTAWTNATLTARRSVVYTDTAGASSTDPTWGWVDFGADVASVNGTYQISWDATGLVVYDVS